LLSCGNIAAAKSIAGSVDTKDRFALNAALAERLGDGREIAPAVFLNLS